MSNVTFISDKGPLEPDIVSVSLDFKRFSLNAKSSVERSSPIEEVVFTAIGTFKVGNKT